MAADKTVYLEVDQAVARLDQYLAAELPELSRSQLKKLIQQQKVLVDHQPAKPSTALKAGDLVTVHLPAPEPGEIPAETIPLDIIFEDDDLIVVNKPAGMVVHPGQGHSTGTLVNALLARYPDLAALVQSDEAVVNRPGLVHRLDRDTSGLMIVARHATALSRLQQQFKSRKVEKIYLALIFGRPEAPEGIIDVPLGRDPRHRQKIAPRLEGKPARTHYRLVKAFHDYSLLEVKLETGRTHQIRVHLAWLKYPVVGDTVYGRRRNLLGLERQFLHAWRLGFQHPRSQTWMAFEAPLPDDLQTILDQLGTGG